MPESLTVAPPRTAVQLRHYSWRLARILLIAYAAVLVLLMLFENSLIYFPSKYPSGNWQPAMVFEDAWFTASDGTKLHGWYLHHPKPRAVVLFLHGNAGNISHRAEVLRQANRLDMSILAIDYRGYGRSEGAPDEPGILADARAARDWLAERAGVPPASIVLWGESLGGAVAVDLATEGARGLVLENTFTSLCDAAACHYPWVPVRWLMRHQLNSLEKIKQYRGPLLQFHGDADTIVPYELGCRLFEAAPGTKQFVCVAGGDHNDLRTDTFWSALDEFLNRL